MSAPLAYTLRDAATAASVSPAFLRRAIKSQGRPDEPPPLPAKFIGGRAGYRVRHVDLVKWVDALPDA